MRAMGFPSRLPPCVGMFGSPYRVLPAPSRTAWLLLLLAILVGSCVEELDVTEGELPVPVEVGLEPVKEPELQVTARDVPLHLLRLEIWQVESGEELAAGDVELAPDSLPERFRIRQDVAPNWEVALEGTLELIRVLGEEEAPEESAEWAVRLEPVIVSAQDEATWDVELAFGRGDLEEQEVTGVELEQLEEPLVEGGTMTLSAATTGGPEGARVFWGATDPEVAMASGAGEPGEGVLVGLGPGQTTVIAASGRQWAQVEVQVLQRVDQVVVEPAQATLTSLDDQVTFSAEALDPRDDPVADRELEVVWEVADPEVAVQVEGGVFQAEGPGETEITATVEGVQGTASLVVEVEEGGVFEGDLLILDDEDLAEFAEGGWAEVDGDLTIGGEGSSLTDLTGLETLRQVTGNLVVSENPSLTDLTGLGGLEEVGGELSIEDNPSLETLGDFPDLESTGLDLRIRTNDVLTAVPEFPSLVSVGRTLNISANPSLETLGGFPALESTGLSLRIVDNDVLTEIPGFPGLVSVGQTLSISANPGLEAVEAFPALEEVGTFLQFIGNEALPALPEFTLLSSIGGNLVIEGNSALEDLDPLAGVTSKVEDLVVSGNDALADVWGLSNLGSSEEGNPAVQGGFIVTDNPNLPTSQAEELADHLGVGGEITIEGNLDDEPGAVHEGDLEVFDQEDLDAFAESGWEEVDGNLTIGGEGSPLVDLDGMETLRRVTGDLEIRDTEDLADISALSDLVEVQGELVVFENTALETVPSFPGLEVLGAFVVSRNESLVEIGEAPLVEETGQFVIQLNPALEIIDDPLPALRSVEGNILLLFGQSLQEIRGLEALEAAGGLLQIGGSAALTAVPSFPSLREVGEGFFLSEVGEIEELEVAPALESAGALIIQFNASLHTLTGFGLLQSLEGELRLFRNDELTVIGPLSSLEAVGGPFRVERNLALTTLEAFQTLATIGGDLEIALNPVLADLDGLSGVTSTLGDLLIDNNESLQDVWGLSNIGSAEEADPAVEGDFTVTDNPTLPTSQVEELADLLGVGGEVTIEGNLDDEPGPVHEGDLEVFDQEDLDAFAESGWEEVDGNLTIGGEGSPLVDLEGMETLRRVTGDLLVTDNPSLTDLSALGGMEEVGGEFRVEDNPSLEALGGFPALGSVGGGVRIQDNPALTLIPEFPNLESADGGLFINRNIALEVVEGFPVLSTLGPGTGGQPQALRITDNDVLTAAPEFPSLVSADGHLAIERNEGLESLGGFPVLEGVGGVLIIGHNPSLLAIPEFPALESIAWYLWLQDNEGLESVGGFPSLSVIGDAVAIAGLRIHNNDALETVPAFPALASMPTSDGSPGTLSIWNNASLQELGGFPALEGVDDLLIQFNPSLTVIGAFLSLDEITGAIQVRDNTLLEDLDAFAEVTSRIQDLLITENLSLSSLAGLENLGLETNRPEEPAVQGDYTVTNNPNLPTSQAEDLADLLGVGGEVTIEGNLDDSPEEPSLATIATGGSHACALTEEGDTYCWGDNAAGQLGTGDNEPSLTPVEISAPPFTDLQAAESHTCGLTESGDVYCWGRNNSGQLGDGSLSDRNFPAPVSGEAVFDEISVGGSHVCARTSAGDVYCWGSNHGGQIGAEGTQEEGCAFGGPCNLEPTLLEGSWTFASVRVGFAHSCALDGEGLAYCWGRNSTGQLGDGTQEDRESPTPVAGEMSFSALQPSVMHTCGLAGGLLYCWGRDLFGSTATGSYDETYLEPEGAAQGHSLAVASTPTNNWIRAHGCGIEFDGSAFCWGPDPYGQLGSEAEMDQCEQGEDTFPCTAVPVAVQGPPPLETIRPGRDFTCGTTSDGEGWCWGNNEAGQLGHGHTSQSEGPARVDFD